MALPRVPTGIDGLDRMLGGGFVEKSILNATQVEAIADLPSREVMIARMLGSMMSPISKFAIALNEIAKKQGGAEA